MGPEHTRLMDRWIVIIISWNMVIEIVQLWNHDMFDHTHIVSDRNPNIDQVENNYIPHTHIQIGIHYYQ